MVEDLDYAPGPLEKLITMKTAECEGIERTGDLLERACAARVEAVAGPHDEAVDPASGFRPNQSWGFKRRNLSHNHGGKPRLKEQAASHSPIGEPACFAW